VYKEMIQIHGWTSLSCCSKPRLANQVRHFCSALSSALLSRLAQRRHRSLVSVSPTIRLCLRRNERKLEARKKGKRAWERGRNVFMTSIRCATRASERACVSIYARWYSVDKYVCMYNYDLRVHENSESRRGWSSWFSLSLSFRAWRTINKF